MISKITDTLLGLLTGVALGILVGLSVSPVVGGVITALLAGALAAAQAFGERLGNHAFRVIAIITIGTAIGALAGIYLRVNHVLQISPAAASHRLICGIQVDNSSMQREMDFWRAAGLQGQDVAARLFQAYLSQCALNISTNAGQGKEKNDAKSNVGKVALFAISRTECDSVLDSDPAGIVGQLKSSESLQLKLLGYSTMSPEAMRTSAEQICQSIKQ